MKILDFPHKDKRIVLSEGGCTIIDSFGDLSLPSNKFKPLFEKHGLDKKVFTAAIVKYYNQFFKIKS